MHRWAPAARPDAAWALVALVPGTLVHAAWLALWPGAALGAVVGPVPAALPQPLVLAPLLQPGGWARLLAQGDAVTGTAVALALIGSLESGLKLIGSLESGLNRQALDQLLQQRHDPRRELLAVGAANVRCGALAGLPAVAVFIAMMNRAQLRTRSNAVERPSRRIYPAALEARLQPLSLNAGQRLFSHGQVADALYLLSAGSISIVDDDGRRLVSVSPGMMFGEAGLLHGGTRSAHAVADQAALVQRLSLQDLQALQQQHPELVAALYRNIAVFVSSRLRTVTGAWWASQA